ncbi:MAG: anti-sigma factor, partial [Thermodesulfobacteriota bacterium]
MRTKEELEELISIYALGALDGEELAEVEEILATDQEARDILAKYQGVASHLAYSSKARMPDPSLKKKMLSELLGQKKSTYQEVKTPFWKRFQLIGFSFGAVAAAVLMLIIVSPNQSQYETLGDNGAVITELNQTISDQQELINNLKISLEEKQVEYKELEDHYAKLDELSEFLEHPSVHIIQLTNMHTDEDAGVGVLYHNDDDKAFFYCLDLEHPPEGKDYQWWVKANGEHKSVAVFKVDAKGSHFVELEALSDLGNIEHYSVTIEPEGGAERPSSDMIFAGDHRG